MCSSHYSTWYRAKKKHTITCAYCGETKGVSRPHMQYCDALCKQRGLLQIARASEGMAKHKAALAAKPKPARKTKSSEELEALWKSQRSPLRAAYEDQDWLAVIESIKARSQITDNGCWEWQGQTSKAKKSSGCYPVVSWGANKSKSYQVHRMSLEAKHGKPLGKQAAHHKCANTLCVNPKHLQPVTHAQNSAEMLARRYYESRIADLEQALSAAQPEHPLLNEIGVPVLRAA